ncbi:DNA-binding GntR family transcriptional regulator [Azospirillum lipoferum]|uniref:GntR family transcriptional regulator n=1 Tax=Azospirillum lipoferum TaxID=193 RepID=A0A5A9GND6_AZOLI|nr:MULTISPECIES: GntR family transcriptional regulator [Azospirillum]KAA0595941.1 GntR family transcriptional regulator [Azospirillum lipoferum]MCP1610830.1 DNA-binding GntR family transcriptional regulator [Azospirillum lipoferum]MDW5534019.1 GntR family transcriptional regulator [Azospirillum sp. NL1]
MKSDTQETQADAVAGKIRALILNGTFHPGQPLRQEALSEQLGVSRTPLRHALQSLAEDGLVEITGYKGARVKELDQGMVSDLFDMRLLLEPLALRSALRHHTKLDFAKAEMALDAADAEQDLAKLAELNWDFHYALYRPSNRQTLLRTIEQLNKASAFAEVMASSIAVRSEKSSSEHRKLLQACQNGDEVGAVSMLREHLQLARHDIRNWEE